MGFFLSSLDSTSLKISSASSRRENILRTSTDASTTDSWWAIPFFYGCFFFYDVSLQWHLAAVGKVGGGSSGRENYARNLREELPRFIANSPKSRSDSCFVLLVRHFRFPETWHCFFASSHSAVCAAAREVENRRRSRGSFHEKSRTLERLSATSELRTRVGGKHDSNLKVDLVNTFFRPCLEFIDWELSESTGKEMSNARYYGSANYRTAEFRIFNFVFCLNSWLDFLWFLNITTNSGSGKLSVYFSIQSNYSLSIFNFTKLQLLVISEILMVIRTM